MESTLDWRFQDADYHASAEGSPCKRVPFLLDGDLLLTDSSSILMHVRELANKPFISTVAEMELYTQVNTAMDTSINLFLLGRDELTADSSDYLARQKSRVEAILDSLDKHTLSQSSFNDAELRLACFLDWAVFRKRIELTNLDNLSQFLEHAKQWSLFRDTAPPK